MTEDEFYEQYGFNPSSFDAEMEVDVPALPSAAIGASGDAQAQTYEEPQKASTSSSINNEFVDVSLDEVQKLIHEAENKNTIKKTTGDLSKFVRFLNMKNERRAIEDINPPDLDNYVASFILSVRKPTGDEYEPSSIRGMVSSIDRHLKAKRYPCKIICSQSSDFQLTRDALKAKQKGLKKQGKGNKPMKASPITDEELDIMYKKEVLGSSSPRSVLNTVWLNNCIHFGLRGTKENYELRWGDVTLKTAADGSEYIELNERQTKTRTGENICDVRPVAPKMFSTNDPERDPISIYKLYSSKRPTHFCSPNDPFYIAPRTIKVKSENEQWFTKMKVGEKKLGGMLKKMANEAGLEPNKRITNHSARKHLVQKLRDSGVAPTDIMQISGHKNVQSVINYSSISENQQRQCSNILADNKQSTSSSSSSFGSKPVEFVNTDTNLTQSVCAPNQPVVNSQLNSLNINKNSESRLQSLFAGSSISVQTLNVYMN